MKRGGYAAVPIIVFAVIVIVVLIASFALSGQAPKVATPAATLMVTCGSFTGNTAVGVDFSLVAPTMTIRVCPLPKAGDD